MNILFYLADTTVGGIRTVTESLSTSLIQRGHRVTWLVHRPIYGDSRDVFADVKNVFLEDAELCSETNIGILNETLKENQIDVIVNQHGLYEGIHLLEKREGNVPIISVLHSNPISNYDWLFQDCATLRNQSFTEYLKRIARIVLYPRIKRQMWQSLRAHYLHLISTGSYINVLSPRYEQTLQRVVPSIDKVSSISNPNTYSSVGDCHKEKMVLFVGRLDNRSKKLQYMIRIWQAIESKVSGWRLVIVGSGPDELSLKRLAGKSSTIDFVGYQNPRTYYEKASVICMTSIFEGFPMAITEGMQHGCVPIAFDSFPAIYDVITSGVDGEIVKALDKKEYARRLKYLLQHDDYRNQLSCQAKESVKRFDIDCIVTQWENLLNQVITAK